MVAAYVRLRSLGLPHRGWHVLGPEEAEERWLDGGAVLFVSLWVEDWNQERREEVSLYTSKLTTARNGQHACRRSDGLLYRVHFTFYQQNGETRSRGKG
jgi:hypothetical protein